MKNLLIGIILLAYTMVSQHNDYITIEHFGDSDKPIETIIISKKSLIKPYCKNFIVTDKVFNILKNVVKEYKEKNQYTESEFGSFKVTINEYGKKKLNYYFGRINSIQLFNSFINSLNQTDNNGLISALKTNNLRIRLKN